MSSSSSHTNVRYLTTPEKRLKISHLTKRARSAEKEVKRLQEKVAMLIKHADELDPQLHHDLVQVMEENSEKIHREFPEGSFRRVFWDQQIKNARVKDSRQVRWHPLMIKWCLNMRLISGASFITLSSDRTLRDYTNYITG